MPIISGKSKTSIRAMVYDSKDLVESEPKSADECISLIKRKKVAWINIDGLGDAGLLESISGALGIHPLVMEDVLHTRQRPKLEDYDDYLYIVTKMLTYDGKNGSIRGEQVSMILGKNYVLTFQEKEGDIFEPMRIMLRKSKGRVRRSGPDFLAYSLLDLIVDNYFLILEKVGERTETMEESVIRDPSPQTLQKVRKLKREMLFLRKSVWPMRELLLSLERESTNRDPLVSKTTALYIRDVYDHTVGVIDTTETLREVTSGMVEMYLSSISNRMNEIMKVLTLVGTIFIPLTFITGIYGMNFKYMPELGQWWAYPIVLGIMLLTAIAMVYHFKKKDWI